MREYIDLIWNAYVGYAGYLWREITQPTWQSYFYWLLGLSLVVWALELIIPWRKKQPMIRKDFWLDAWYMLFNFFVFWLIAYNAVSEVVVFTIRNFTANVLGIHEYELFSVAAWPGWAQLLTLFVLRDFIQWNIHRLLHRVPWLWRFHQVHHSVEQMGFAAHLRYHWMETVVYRGLEYLPLAMVGFGLSDFFVVYIFTLIIGHLNHANVSWDYGPLKYIFNNPKMHIWHHAKTLPHGTVGVNYAITLSVWDYLFGTAHIPSDGRDIALGFEQVEAYPQSFWKQMIEPFKRRAAS